MHGPRTQSVEGLNRSVIKANSSGRPFWIFKSYLEIYELDPDPDPDANTTLLSAYMENTLHGEKKY
jgi:hypothetical protein